MQGLYSWLMTANNIQQIEAATVADSDIKKVDMAFFHDLLRNTVSNAEQLDIAVKPYLGRLPEEIDAVEKSIIRLAVYELMHRLDVPYKVVINEAIELAKTFGAADSHKFVNGVLDKAVKKFRADERSPTSTR